MSRLLHRLSWYKNRLSAMTAEEAFHRLQEMGRRSYDRAFGDDLIAPLGENGALPEIPGLVAGMDAWQIPDMLLNQWHDDAEAAQKGDFFFFAKKWPSCPRAQLWHIDPHSGTLWPHKRYCFAIDYRHTSEKGDIKYVWELNRLQYIQPIAALARKKKDAKLARFCLAEIESWIDHNPPFYGINWSSGIELSLRIISILAVTSLVGEYLCETARAKIWASLHTHGRWIARYPSLYSSANNHRTVEGLGLFVLGTLCQHWTESEIWKKTGWDILCDAAQRQILPDGVGAEQSVAYTASVLEALLTGLKIAQAHSVAIADPFMRKLVLGGEYLRWLCDKEGDVPHIGDGDDACIFGTHHRGDHYASSILNSIAAVTSRADLAVPTHPHLRQALFGFPPAPDFAPYGVRCFPYGGLTIGRHRTAHGDIMLAFDHGYLGYLSLAAHGHADALAIWLHIGGQAVFVDAGTYLYHGDHKERAYFRSTAAHNTLTLEGTSSSTMAGNFNWSDKAHTALCNFVSHGDSWQIAAEHDGYAKKLHSIHQRRINVSGASGAVIEDSLIASRTHLVEINFLLHPDLVARQEGREILLLKGEQLLLRMRHESDLKIHIGTPHTVGGGWYSPAFGIKRATTRVSFRGYLPLNQKAVTHLFWAA